MSTLYRQLFSKCNFYTLQTCQEAIERSRVLKTSMSKVHVPTCAERINRVTMFMQNYEDKTNVLIPGLDAIMTYTENADCPHSLQDTKVIKVCVSIFELYKKQSAIVWRVCAIFAKVSLFSDDVASTVIDPFSISCLFSLCIVYCCLDCGDEYCRNCCRLLSNFFK
jgi:hypothetical protein